MDAQLSVDATDIEFVNLLQNNPCAAWAELSPQLSLTPPNLSRRWNRLRRHHLAWSGIALHPGRSYGAFIEIRCKPSDITTVTNQLVTQPDIITVGHSTGLFNLYAICISTSVTRVLDRTSGSLLDIPEIQRVCVSLFNRINGGVTWNQGLGDPLDTHPAPETTARDTRLPDFDETDEVKRLFTALAGDARKPTAAVARELDMSTERVARITAEMQDKNFITYRVDVARPIFDYRLGMKLLVKVPPLRARQLAEEVGHWSETRFCCETANTSNLILIASLRNFEFGEALVARLLKCEPTAEIVSRDVCTKMYKVYGWTIAEDGRQDGLIPVQPWAQGSE